MIMSVCRQFNGVFSTGKRNQKANIVIETSGDTGPAAIAGVKKCKNVDIFCLYPFQRVSVSVYQCG